MPLITTMLSTIRRFSMIERGDRVLVAVSGGPDSVALLHALWSLRDDLGITLHVAHLNHSIRGKDSDEDAEYVRNLAEQLGIGCTVEKADVPQIRRTLRLSEEETARVVRYDFLERTASDVDANRIALGHTADDQVETVLFNFLRGTGIDGLAGIPPVRDRIIRPLIETRRSEVEEYVKQHNLHPRIDLTNLQPAYTRNRIRLELLPLLRRDFNLDVDSAVLRLQELAREDVAYINVEAEEAYREVVRSRENGSVSLDAGGIRALPVAMKRRLVRLAVREVRGEIADIGLQHVDELLRLLDTGREFQYEFPGGTHVRLSGSELVFSAARPAEVQIEYCRELVLPGETPVPEIGAVVRSEIVEIPVDFRRPAGSMEIVLDYQSIVGKLLVRNWRSGDRIRPLGLGGSKKIQDIFVDAKIPRNLRSRVPVISDEEKVLWIAGLAVSDEAKVTDFTTQFLLLSVCDRDITVV